MRECEIYHQNHCHFSESPISPFFSALPETLVKSGKGADWTSQALTDTLGWSLEQGEDQWGLLASWTGLPVSTSHALTGAIVGVGLVAFESEGLLEMGLGRRLSALILSPLVALMVFVIVHPLIRKLAFGGKGPVSV
ncbi:MAG: hypothetical protein FJ245_12315 [Nitrospira sp.]|nr:hypothetical protein [Nitrospira sp.]